jgi:peptide methionine sulfoxide reductase MsrB
MALTDEQKKILHDKGTEPPFSGKLLGNRRKDLQSLNRAHCSLRSK